jgi:hypothetical protein
LGLLSLRVFYVDYRRATGFVNLFWPFCFGGCSLERSTDEMIRRVGKWEEVHIKPFEGQNAYMPIPGMLGYFVKK